MSSFPIRVKKLHNDAIIPSKGNSELDSGYDVTLLYLAKKIGNVEMYGTHIAVQPPPEWYLDLVPRSSLIKTGYIMANSFGVIDSTYRGEVLVPLVKIDPNAPDILANGPIRAVQLIPRPLIHFPVVEVEELSDTTRGAGGFGSTGTSHKSNKRLTV